MRLLLVRHGQSHNNLYFSETGGGHNRWPDPGLTPLGHRQAARLAQAFAAGRLPRPDRILSSLMLRAVETVAPVAAALDLPVEGRLDLHEVGGVFEGEFLESAARGHPGAPAGQLLAACPQLHLPEGVDETGWYRLRPEPIDEGRVRAERVVAGLRQDYGPTDEVLAVVAHGWFFQYILGAFLGLGLGPDGHLPQWFTFKNTATAYLVEPDTDHFHNLRIVWLNRTDHLTARQVTE